MISLDDSYPIANEQDIYKLVKKRYVYSAIISLTNIIEELESYGLYYGCLKLIKIARAAERYRLNDIKNIYKIENMNEFYEPLDM